MSHSPTYTTYQEIEDDVTLSELLKIVPVVDTVGETVISATVDTDRIDRIIETVSNKMDGIIGQRYTTPLVAIAIPAIEWIARALAICMIFVKESGGPEWRQENCKKAEEVLDGIASGKMDIPGISAKSSKGARSYSPYADKDKGGYTELRRDMRLFEESRSDNTEFMR